VPSCFIAVLQTCSLLGQGLGTLIKPIIAHTIQHTLLFSSLLSSLLFSSLQMDPNEVQHSHCLEMTMELHQVVPPPHKTTLTKLKTRLKETFFPDDPLRQFKGQPLKTKLILAAQYLFPILQWGPKYTFKLFKSDLVAGLTIASLAIPQVSFFSILSLFSMVA